MDETDVASMGATVAPADLAMQAQIDAMHETEQERARIMGMVQPTIIDEYAIEVDPLLMIGAGLLVQGGVITPSMAREMIGLPPFTQNERQALRRFASYSRRSGGSWPVELVEFWPEDHGA